VVFGGLGVVVLAGEEACLVLEVVTTGVLEVFSVLEEVFFLVLLVVTTFWDMCTSSISLSSPP
jgi:hypothetical protein